MDKENAFTTPHRISQNFRIVKHLLPHKRAFDTPADHFSNKTRVPLQERSINTLSSSARSICDVSNERRVTYPFNGKCLFDSYEMPVKRVEPASLSDLLSTPSVLDDEDFDESVFEEIDAICLEKSSVKPDRPSQSSDFISGIESSSVIDSAIERIEVKDELCLLEGLIFEAEKTDTCQTKLNGSMPDEYAKYLKSLNDKQREAACSDISVPLMIAAGPGSGKTSTMVGRILVLLNEGISPSNILAMTFTTAAASEMRDRIGAVAGKSAAKELMISTFHSFSLQLCRLHAEKIGRTTEFLIYGHGQQRRAIIEAVRLFENEKNSKQDNDKAGEVSDCLISPQHYKDKSKKWQKFVAQAKASGKTPADCRRRGDEMGAAILGNYNDILKTCNALDYHDLISYSVKLLTDFPEVLIECQELWKAIVIDEFQDTSAMQYGLMRMLASHNHITIVGDDDQSIFSFNGADISGFDSFRRDFPNYKEIKLDKNYRSTRCIIEAATSLIKNNKKRLHSKDALTDNSLGSKIIIKECQNEDAQCSFIVDKILETASGVSADKVSYGNIAILYRKQVSGKAFQLAFRERKIPFNIHGVAFYRKKVVRAVISMLKTTLPGCDDGSYRRVFKALLPLEKEEIKRVIEHIDKISVMRKCSFISVASDVFNAKISGTFKRTQLTQGRKVLLTLDMISKLVYREQSISAVITSVANMIPQKYLLEQRAVIDNDGGKLLNEDNDIRSVLQYLLDDVSEFLSKTFATKEEENSLEEEKGCVNILKGFVDFISERETENFRSRRHDNENSVTLTTMHQSKGLEWDIVFIVKANESEIPLLHEYNGVAMEHGTSVEEERRLLYVALTRARKKLFILYVMMDSNWQMLQPSRFLKELPSHLLEIQAEVCVRDLQRKDQNIQKRENTSIELQSEKQPSESENMPNDFEGISDDMQESLDAFSGNSFLKRFAVEERLVVSHMFHQWAKKVAFRDPKRLIGKVGFVIDERLSAKKNKNKDVLRALKSCLSSDEAFHYAEYVSRWEQIPADRRAHMMREKQEHFQKLRIENSMASSEATPKQVAYLQSLGCTTIPTSRLHASTLIEQYKSL
ncbi:hypothetical protein ACFE04_026846 [Oxalis oulophora]